MRVLVVGATGAIGRPLISALVASRREVIGISSTEHGVQILRDKGAEAFLADALDRNAIEAVIVRLGRQPSSMNLLPCRRNIRPKKCGRPGARSEIEARRRAQRSGCGDRCGR